MYNDLTANKTIAHKAKKKKITVVKGEKEFKRWREFLIGEKFSKSTQYRYARSIADMINFLNKQPHNIKQNDIDRYKIELAKQYSRNSMTPPIAAINSFFANILKKPNLRLKAPKKKIVNKGTLQAPPHQPGLLPRWLHERGTNIIIAGGMGARAQELFAKNSIQVVIGAPPEDPENVAAQFLEGTLTIGDNICDH